MDPIFATVVLGFFTVIVAVVAVTYSNSSVARLALKSLDRLTGQASTEIADSHEKDSS